MPKIPQRIPNLPEEKWTPDVQEIFPMMVPPGSPMKGSDFNSILMLVQHPQLSKSWLTYNKALSAGWTIPGRTRELAILRVGWLLKAEYEWVQHMIIGHGIGLDAETFARVTRGSEDSGWSEEDRLVLRAAELACAMTPIDQATWDGLARHFEQKQLLELLYAIGTYVMLAWIFNSTGVELEEQFAVYARSLGWPMIED